MSITFISLKSNKTANNLLCMKSQTYLRPLDEVFYVTYETDLWNTQEIGFICDADLLRDRDRRHWFTMSDLGGEVKKKNDIISKMLLEGRGLTTYCHDLLVIIFSFLSCKQDICQENSKLYRLIL